MEAAKVLEKAFQLAARNTNRSIEYELELRIQNEEFSLSPDAWKHLKDHIFEPSDAYWCPTTDPWSKPETDLVMLYPNEMRRIEESGQTVWQHKERLDQVVDSSLLCPYRMRLSLSKEERIPPPPPIAAIEVQRQRMRTRVAYWLFVDSQADQGKDRAKTLFEFHLTQVVETDVKKRNKPQTTLYEFEVEFKLHNFVSVDQLLTTYNQVIQHLQRIVPHLQAEKTTPFISDSHNAFRAFELTQALLDAEDIRLKRPVNFPNPLLLPYEFLTWNLDDYSVTNKLNGEYVRLLRLPNGEWYATSETTQHLLPQLSSDAGREGCCVLEAEEYKNEFYVFDVVLWNGQSVLGLSHEDRLNQLKQTVTGMHVKEFRPAVDAGEMLNHLDPSFNDGLIFTPVGPATDPNEPIYKWKFPDQMSIDMRVAFSNGKGALLIHDGDGCEKEWKGTKLFAMTMEMLPLKMNEYVNQIVEVVWDTVHRRLAIARPRPDKRTPNFRTVAENVWNDMFLPILPQTLRCLTDPIIDRRWSPEPFQPSMFLGKYGNEFIAKTQGTVRVKFQLRDKLYDGIQSWAHHFASDHSLTLYYPDDQLWMNSSILTRETVLSKPQMLWFGSRNPVELSDLSSTFQKSSSHVLRGEAIRYDQYTLRWPGSWKVTLKLSTRQATFDVLVDFTGNRSDMNVKPWLDLRLSVRQFLAQLRQLTAPLNLLPLNTATNDVDYMRLKWSELREPPSFQPFGALHDKKIRSRFFPIHEKILEWGWFFQMANGTYLLNQHAELLVKWDEIPTRGNRSVVAMACKRADQVWCPFQFVASPPQLEMDQWADLHAMQRVSSSSSSPPTIIALQSSTVYYEANVVDTAAFLEKYQEPLTEMRLLHNQIKGELIQQDTGGSTVLDLGIGQGGDLGKYDKVKLAHLWGVDPNMVNLAECQKRLAESFPSLQPIVSLQPWEAQNPLIPEWVKTSASQVKCDVHFPVEQPEVSILFPSVMPPSSLTTPLTINEEGEYSITRRADGDAMMAMLLDHLGPEWSEWNVVDGTANMGGDTLNFAKYARQVHAVEYSEANFKYLAHNVNAYGYANVHCHQGDIRQMWAGLAAETDVLYLDPPWGGKGYKHLAVVDLYLGDHLIEDFLLQNVLSSSSSTSRLKYVLVKVPKNARLLRNASTLFSHVPHLDILPLEVHDRFTVMVMCLLPAEQRYRGWKRIGVTASFFSLSFFFFPSLLSSSSSSSSYPAADAFLQNVMDVVAEGGRFIGTTIDGRRLRTLLSQDENRLFRFDHGRGHYQQLDEHTVEVVQPGTIIGKTGEKQIESFVDFEYVRNHLIERGWSIDVDKFFDRLKRVDVSGLSDDETALHRLYRVFSLRAPFTFRFRLQRVQHVEHPSLFSTFLIFVTDPTNGVEVEWQGTDRFAIERAAWRGMKEDVSLSHLPDGVYEVMYTDWSDASRPRFYVMSSTPHAPMSLAHVSMKWNLIHM